MLTEIKADLFSTNVPAICHGCNCQGKFGAGIAVAFRRKYPVMFEEYKRLCNRGEFNLGDIFLYDAPDGKLVGNLATQVYPGPDARHEAIETALRKFFLECRGRGIGEVAMPRIGCGLGGLSWAGEPLDLEPIPGVERLPPKPVKQIVESLADELGMVVTIYRI